MNQQLRPLALGIALGLILCAAACDKKPSGEWIVDAKDDDARLAAAKAEAHARWGEFTAAFAKREPNTAYSVKAPLTSPTGTVEVMWLQVTEINETSVTGTLDNIPIGDFTLKHGDPVSVPIADIEDWIIGRGADNITGAFSIPALREIDREAGGK